MTSLQENRERYITPEVTAHIAALVAGAPPFTPAQKERLRALLHPPKRAGDTAAA